jgi:hypothetical protein
MAGITPKDDAREIAVDSPAPRLEISENLFAVLAERASGRSSAELWTTAIGGSTNAIFILTQHPRLHWLGAGFIAAASYGVWGLANRAIVTQRTHLSDTTLDLLRGVRGIMIPIGVVSAIAAAGSFMAVALSGWIH